jgi:hypothetical protein
MSTRVDILPSSEKQVRVLKKIEPEKRAEVFAKAIEIAGGEQPTSRSHRQHVRGSSDGHHTDTSAKK